MDILAHQVESITWTGNGSVEVTSPSGVSIGDYEDGDTIEVDENGVWMLDPQRDQSFDWSVDVQGASGGRLHSFRWKLDGGSYDEADGFSTSLYALVPAGADGYDVVIELQIDGLSGYVHDLVMNGQGAGGRSMVCPNPDCTDVEVDDPYPIYVSPPEIAAYSAIDPKVEGLGMVIEATDETECGILSPGISEATITFASNVSGTYAFVCDLNNDEAFDRTSDDDLLLLGEAVYGENNVTWDGTNNGGEVVPSGSYDCIMQLSVGEMHLLALDIETMYQGMRFYQVDSDGGREGLAMYWNDSAVQDTAITMPNGEVSPSGSGASGRNPGPYTDAVSASDNARA